MFEAVLIVSACWWVLGSLAVRCAYLNGAVDGYGYSRDPGCPGYARAGAHLRKYMTHRWSELKDDA